MDQPVSAILIDDEDNALSNLKHMVQTYCPAITITDTATEIETAAALINRTLPDAIFLDIALAGNNGFDLLPLLKHKPHVVFVTAHEQYALRAIKACAVDFLLKPIDINELKSVEEKLQQLRRLSENFVFKSGYDQSLAHLSGMLRLKEPLRTITIPDTSGYQIVSTDNILYLEGKDNYTFIYISGQNRMIVSRTLKDFETILQDSDFLRIHKSSMINLRHLKSMRQKEGLSVVMADGKEFPVSRRRGNSLMERARAFL